MYIIIAFMGICFDGASAISHAFLSFKVSVSTGLAAAVEGCCCWARCEGWNFISWLIWFTVGVRRIVSTCFPALALVKPGGLGMLEACLERAGIGELSLVTQSGGGGGGWEVLGSIVIVILLEAREMRGGGLKW